jgi:UDP-glucose-4-epimerase GalE
MSKPFLLVAGGAGYIGSHFCKAAAEAGFTPVVIDRLIAGTKKVEQFRRESVKWGPLEVADYGDSSAVHAIISRYQPVAAVCFAALIEVAESMAEPALYIENNFMKAARFFNALEAEGVDKLVFSSTAAVYGQPTHRNPLTETDALAPINTYGVTKLGCELLLQGTNSQSSAAFLQGLPKEAELLKPRQLKSAVFRYFNAAGADVDAGLGEMHEPESHLIPNALFTASGMRGAMNFSIFGTDYATPDGTPVRDYVHVTDLADAHVRGVRYLMGGGASDVFNLGTGQGYSVREVVNTVRETTGKNFPVAEGQRRAGDPAMLVANAAKAEKALGWTPKLSLDDIVSSAYEFHKKFG